MASCTVSMASCTVRESAEPSCDTVIILEPMYGGERLRLSLTPAPPTLPRMKLTESVPNKEINTKSSMSYSPVGNRVTGGEIDDCDPTHYAGGYDIDLTYGRSLPPSYETCYPYKSSASDHPQFASHSKPSAYAFEAMGSEYNSFSGPKARPEYPAFAGSDYGGPRPNYGFQPGGGVSEHGGRHEYARPDPGYGFGYGMNPPNSKFGSSHGRSSEYENPSLMHDNSVRKPDFCESGYGPGVRQPDFGFGGSRHESGGSGYGGWPERPTYPKPNYPQPSYSRPSHPEPCYPMPSYPEPSYPMPSYPTPGYDLQKHEHDNSDHERRKHHHQQSHRRQ